MQNRTKIEHNIDISMRFYRLLEKEVNKIVKDYSLTVQSFFILLEVQRVLDNGDNPIQHEIGRILLYETPSISRQLDRIEQKGFVTREVKTPKRIYVRITKKGHKQLEMARNAINEKFSGLIDLPDSNKIQKVIQDII